MDQYPDTPFQKWLTQHGACSEGREFVGSMTPQEFWDKCVADNFAHIDWMVWLLEALRREGYSVSSLMLSCGCCCSYDLIREQGASFKLPDFLPVPEQPVQVDNPSQRKVFFVVFPDQTYTYLSAEDRDRNWVGGGGVWCEADVTEQDYDALAGSI